MESTPVANPTSTDTITVLPNDATAHDAPVANAPNLAIAGRLLDPALLAAVAATVDISTQPTSNGNGNGNGNGAAVVDGTAPVTTVGSEDSAAKCPFPSLAATASTCPFPGLASSGSGRSPMTAPNGTRRTPADMFMRRLLRISDQPAGVSNARVLRTFQKSMMISAVRCTLTYVIFPFVLPGIGFLKGVGPVVGILIGSFALVCDTFTIRRFFVADHKWRWQFSAIAFAVMCLLVVLLVRDVSQVVGNLIA
ncbi:MAG: hypothetical protein ABI239_07485 [Aquihabitans sp.]